MLRGSTKAASKRLELRDNLWPDAESVVWLHTKYKGFKSIPRLLPLICALIKAKKGKAKGDPTAVYLDLWCRVWDEAFLDRVDEYEFSFSSGYTGNRAVRTWREHIQLLESLGFIRTKSSGNRGYGSILLLDPIRVCVDNHAKGHVDDDWWNAFRKMAIDYGTKLPPATVQPLPPKSTKGK
jgi:hypothetical protein